MNTRDWDYIENRLLAGTSLQLEAYGRLRQVGYPDLAERLMTASQVYHDECRAIRDELRNRGEYRGGFQPRNPERNPW